MADKPLETYDYVIIGSGFGGSVSAMRLIEKGYRVLILERGKRFADEDFAKRNWNIWKYLWIPTLRCFGIFQMTFLKGALIMHGSGVGGGSLGYANVLMEPGEELFEAPAWKRLADWKSLLKPHYATAKRMLGVTPNPRLWPADHALKEIAEELGRGDSFHPTSVAVYFGEEGETVPDPFFGGEGPDRTGCTHCGGCMVGCRYNAKNTLVKNYLYFAEKWGAEVQPERTVKDIRPLNGNQPDDARYEIHHISTTNLISKDRRTVRARNVIVSAGVLGTLRLLFNCRDTTRSLPEISQQLGKVVRTNSEGFVGATARPRNIDYSEGIAITSVFKADHETHIEPVRYPDGSSLIRMLTAPFIKPSQSVPLRFWQTAVEIVSHPIDFLDARIFSRWARRTTILLVMQTRDNLMQIKLGRSMMTLFTHNLVSESGDEEEKYIEASIDVGHQVGQGFAEKIDGIAAGAFNESLFNTPSTAHIMGGVSFGHNADDGVIDLNCEVFNYPGLYIVDGSIIPANPGVNPSLTITALSEYAMTHIPPKAGETTRSPLMISPPQSVGAD